MQNLAGLKNADLVVAHNATCTNAKPLKSWKGKTSELVARMLKLRPDAFYFGDETSLPSGRQDFEAPVQERKAQKGRPVDADEAAVKTAKKAKPAKAVKKGEAPRGAIRAEVERLLLLSEGTDEETKRPLGLTYGEILERVSKKYPEAKTSINCLRWYGAKLNKLTGKAKVVMPLRPKQKAA